ncbi:MULTISPECIES: anti-sigma factor antagonist [unclassified Streptomyces]|uniref:anti-sigma factor antagonist n=1 Tax=unclassified Streptomyces TaxID=2593676 RepID=UPI002475FA38|nr:MULTISPECIES: anti-sigma factor antagonist [unclassified Streptomyces]MDH6451661.1 hypothetical protein [Streptomyces sp. SAI-119]MDH6497782.1 hypothetical protein [Streptomyces sp. SAI-149]
MPLPRLTVHRHDRRKRALIPLAGAIDLESAPQVCAAPARCPSDGIRIADAGGPTPVTFRDRSGLNAFLCTSQRAEEADGIVRPHNPPHAPGRILDLTGAGFPLPGRPLGHLPPALGYVPAPAAPALPHRSAPPVPVLTGGVR